MPRSLYALLVGINKYPNPRNRLKGCIQDIENWQRCLAKQAEANNYSFHPLVLQDEAATRQALIDAFTRHLCQAQAGDVAVFCFAGHGSFIAGQRVFNQTPDEINQTLVCWDSRLAGNRDLVDKELSNLVAKVAEKNPQITLILDCCHSGSASRDPEVVERQLEPQGLDISLEDFYSFESAEQGAIEVSRAAAGDSRFGSRFVFRQGRHILMAACHETETAKEIGMPGGPRGVFSVSLQALLDEADRPMTYTELMTEAGLAIKRRRVKNQAPQLEVIKGRARDHELFFLSGEHQVSDRDIFTLAYQAGWRVNGGRAHGWKTSWSGCGVTLPVFEFAATPEAIAAGTEQLGEVEIQEVQTGFSRVVAVGELVLDKGKTYKVAIAHAIEATELTVFLKGEQAGVATLQRSLEEIDTRLVQATLVDDDSAAMVVLTATGNSYEIARGPRLAGQLLAGESTVPVASRAFAPPISADVAEALKHIEKWLRLYELFAAGGGADGEVTFQLRQNQEVREGLDFRLECDYKNNRWVVPSVQFLVTNNTSSRLYCAMLYLSPEFGIEPGLLQAGSVWVEPGKTGESITFDLAIPERFVEAGIDEYPTFFKLLAASEPFEARAWQQSELECGEREIIPIRPEVWMTKEIAIQCVLPTQHDEKSPIVTERPASDDAAGRSPIVTERPIPSAAAPTALTTETSVLAEENLPEKQKESIEAMSNTNPNVKKPTIQKNIGGVTFNNHNVTDSQVNQSAGDMTVSYNPSLFGSGANKQSEPEETKTILFLAANPKGTVQLQLDAELREIDESLRRSQKRSRFKLENKGAVRMQDFHRAILDTRPEIIHFSGHGTGEEGLALEDSQGNVVFLSTAKVERLFKLFGTKGVECVFLNACYSEAQAAAIQKHIPYVVGMNQSITDTAAIQFATAFYDGIGAGEDIESAFELGCISLMDLGKDDIPQLLRRSA